jgi:hypothetical protein
MTDHPLLPWLLLRLAVYLFSPMMPSFVVPALFHYKKYLDSTKVSKKNGTTLI